MAEKDISCAFSTLEHHRCAQATPPWFAIPDYALFLPVFFIRICIKCEKFPLPEITQTVLSEYIKLIYEEKKNLCLLLDLLYHHNTGGLLCMSTNQNSEETLQQED